MGTSPMTDDQIQALLDLPKRVSNPGARMKTQRGSDATNYDVAGEDGSVFRLYKRQNNRIPNGFSCGLLYLPEGGEPVTLTRYNGADHIHSNPLDADVSEIAGCHIHRATHRYIVAGRKPDHYAELTDRYADLAGALRALLFDCKITGLESPPDTPQIQLL